MRRVATAAVVGALAVASLASAGASARGTDESTLADYGYRELSLSGMYGSADVFLPLPAGAEPLSATLELDITHSPLLVANSTLTVTANGIDVASVALTRATAGGTTVEAEIPPSAFGDNGVAIALRAYLRLSDDECEEVDNPAQWVTVLPTSRVTLLTRAGAPPLARLGDVFGTAAAVDGDVRVTTFDLRGDTSTANLAAAAATAWQLGRWHALSVTDPVIAVRDAGGAASVVVAPTAAVPDELIADGVDAAPSGALALRVADDANGSVAPTLVVTGDTAEAVGAAARVVTDAAAVAALDAPVAVLTGEAAAPLPVRSGPWTTESTTFAELGIERREVVGPGMREVFVSVDRPGGWVPDDDGELVLRLDVSGALGDSGSTVQVVLGGVAIGTRTLHTRANPASYSFDIPPGLIDRALDGRPLRALDLQIRLLLDLPTRPCETVDPDLARVTILPTSMFRIPHAEAEERELGRFPHPLEEPTIVIPDDADDATVGAALQIAAALGRWGGPGASPPALTTVGELTGDQRAGDLVLVAGAVDALAGDLDLGTGIAEGDEDTVIVALVESPLDDEADALLLAGDGIAAQFAARALSTRDTLFAMRGSRVAITGDATAALEAPADAVPPPELAPLDEDDGIDVESYVVPAIVIGILLIGVLLLVVWFRWRPAGRRRT